MKSVKSKIYKGTVCLLFQWKRQFKKAEESDFVSAFEEIILDFDDIQKLALPLIKMVLKPLETLLVIRRDRQFKTKVQTENCFQTLKRFNWKRYNWKKNN